MREKVEGERVLGEGRKGGGSILIQTESVYSHSANKIKEHQVFDREHVVRKRS